MALAVNKGIDPLTDPRTLPRSRWAELVAARKYHCLGNIPSDCRTLLKLVTDAEGCEWLGFGTRDRYMLEGLEIEPNAGDLAIEFLRAAHLEVPVAFTDAVDGGRKLRDKPGRPSLAELRNTNGSDYNNNESVSGRGVEYTLARLDRDQPELADRVRAGELSANAAAIEAGFRKQQTPLDRLRAAWRKASNDERQTFLGEVGG